MKTITLEKVCKAPRSIVLQIRCKGGVETREEKRYPHVTAERCLYSRSTKAMVFGLVVQMKERSPRKVIENKGVLCAFRDQARAEKVARWMTDPKGTREEWDLEEGTESCGVK